MNTYKLTFTNADGSQAEHVVSRVSVESATELGQNWMNTGDTLTVEQI